MLFTSVANLSYFEQFNETIDNIVKEMEKDINYADFHTHRSSNFSIIEMAKGSLGFNEDGKNDQDEILMNKNKLKCKC